MIITRTSPLSGVVHEMEIDVTAEQLVALAAPGALIQRVLGHLSPDEREFIATGITAAEWDAYLGGGEDE